MSFKELRDIDVSNLSTMDEKTRKDTIKEGKETYIQAVKDVADKLDLNFLDILKSSIYISDEEIRKQTEMENYELCYFLHNITKEIKKQYKEI
jgi:hypothetical protein